MTDKKLVLRVLLKLFSMTAVLWLAYVLLVGFFGQEISNKTATTKISLQALKTGDVDYFEINNRKLLVLKRNDKDYLVAWSDDPVYGCQIELKDDYLKPVCVDIKYDFFGKGLNKERTVQLKSPDYYIDQGSILIIGE